MRLLSALLLTALACSAQETWTLFCPTSLRKEDETRMLNRVRSLLPELPEGKLRSVPTECKSPRDAQQLADAIHAGVCALPCLALMDARGAYATLPLAELTPEHIRRAQELATAPQRDAQTARRKLSARLYYLRALWQLAGSPAEQDKVITACHEAIHRTMDDPTPRQHIGFYCLYPALMQQYAAGYNGAHTPRTEAKLLEAIAALEDVRDTAPETRLGRLAYDERERLRAARLQSRKYE